MYLVDTNVWLEQLLGQARAAEVGDFFNRIPASELHLTDFAFHSICVVLTRLNQANALLDFTQDVFIDGAVGLVSVPPEETQTVLDTMRNYGLDFDDAYQYTTAEKYNLTIVSFDSDFNRTARGRKTPAEILATP
jgi:predicted nucleic acid-binding protein